jgi:thioredoxin-like negative regulator of GroEL
MSHFSNARLGHAESLIRSRRFTEARLVLAPIAAKDPGNGAARLLLARAQLGCGEHAAAALACTELLKKCVLDDALYVQACCVLFEAGRFSDAMTHLISATRTRPDWHGCAVQLAHWYNAVGEHEKAIELATGTMERSPQHSVDARFAIADARRARCVLGDRAGVDARQGRAPSHDATHQRSRTHGP